MTGYARRVHRKRRWWGWILLTIFLIGGVAFFWHDPNARPEVALDPSAYGRFDRGDNALWIRRVWIHGGDDGADPARLAGELRALGVRRIYPFLGPMDQTGWPGWRDGDVIRRYEPARAQRFFEAMHRAAPEVRVIPWTGGNLNEHVYLHDTRLNDAFADHAARLISLGANGIHVNVEPLPDGTEAYLAFLRQLREAIGSDAILSVAAYPPASPLHPFEEVHWSVAFTREVCEIADELAVMSYDTGLRSPGAYEALMADWTRDLLRSMPTRDDGGCDVLMGVPTYEDDEPYHRPDVENAGHALRGILFGLSREDLPRPLTGVAIYASWTTDPAEWETYERLWRGRATSGARVHDGP